MIITTTSLEDTNRLYVIAKSRVAIGKIGHIVRNNRNAIDKIHAIKKLLDELDES